MSEMVEISKIDNDEYDRLVKILVDNAPLTLPMSTTPSVYLESIFDQLRTLTEQLEAAEAVVDSKLREFLTLAQEYREQYPQKGEPMTDKQTAREAAWQSCPIRKEQSPNNETRRTGFLWGYDAGHTAGRAEVEGGLIAEIKAKYHESDTGMLEAANALLEAENARLREALRIAANRLEGVSLGIAAHGQNINVQFFIETNAQFAAEARQALTNET